MTEKYYHRKELTGIVTKDRMNKTRVVEVVRLAIHPSFKKVIRKRKRYKVHDEENKTKVDDRVRIMETRPLSKEKRWKIVEILKAQSIVHSA